MEIIDEGTQKKQEIVKKEIVIEPIYKGDLSMEDIQENPSLKPILEINKNYTETQKIINNFVWSLDVDKQAINELLELNPIYSETHLMAKVQSLMGNLTHVKFLLESQQEILKKTIREMIEISRQQTEEVNGLREENEELVMKIEVKNKEQKKPGEKQDKAGK